MILYSITLVCDFQDCTEAETVDSDSPETGELSSAAEENGWYWGGEYGNHYCPQHKSHAYPTILEEMGQHR